MAPDERPAALVRPRDVLLVTANVPPIATALEQLPSIRVRALRRLDADGATLSAEQLASLRDAVRDARADRLIIVVGRGGYEVVPYPEA